MNTLYLYNATQTYTNTVFEHINSFAKYSENNSYFLHQDVTTQFNVDLTRFDAVFIHYTIRLPFDQLSESTAKALESFKGTKALFIQDEYDHTHRAWYWIKRLGIQLVFTVVPKENINFVYPQEEFPGVCFVSNMTGYVPEDLSQWHKWIPPSKRKIIIGYRGRPLPLRYGSLGQEKVKIGQIVKRYCDSKKICNDIAWTEEARIYGPNWYKFMASCRAMLGSESGNNAFDWDGTLDARVNEYRNAHPDVTQDELYKVLIEPLERPGLMNQASPRIFEAIAARTVLVLFEGHYSGVVVPNVHFIPLKKDGSNLEEVFALLGNKKYVDKLTEQAYQDVIESKRYGYKSFVAMVDEQLALAQKYCGVKTASLKPVPYQGLTRRPRRPLISRSLPFGTILRPSIIMCRRGVSKLRQAPSKLKHETKKMLYNIWIDLPEPARAGLRPIVRTMRRARKR